MYGSLEIPLSFVNGALVYFGCQEKWQSEIPVSNYVRTVWRYQRGNQNSWIEEGYTTQCD